MIQTGPRTRSFEQVRAITLNETIEILQTEASTNSTLRQFQEIQKKPTASIYYQSYRKKSRNPRLLLTSRIPVLLLAYRILQVPRRKCFRCGESFSRQHMKECRAQNVTCNGCGIKGHLKKCCKKSGNFPKDLLLSRQNQSSTGTGNE